MVSTSEELPVHEWQRARAAFSKVMGDRRWVCSNFELQNICAELNLQPTLEEIERGLEANEGRLDFEGLLCFLRYMKAKFNAAEPADMDTVLCFVAVGGSMDRQGSVEADQLKQTVERFDLSIDIDGLVSQTGTAQAQSAPPASPTVESEGRGQLTFRDFEEIFCGDGGIEGDSPAAAAVHPAEMADIGDDAPTRTVPLTLGLDYQQLLAKEMKKRGLPMPRGRRPTDLLSPKGTKVVSTLETEGRSTTNPISSGPAAGEGRDDITRRITWFNKKSQAGISPALPASRPPGDPAGASQVRKGARGIMAQVVSAPGQFARNNSLRAKGVPALLWGGADSNNAAEHSESKEKDKHGSPRRAGKKRLMPAPPGSSPHKSSQEAILGAGTRVYKSTGLFVDEQPRVAGAPPSQPRGGVPTLPPIRGRLGHTTADSEKSRIVLSIERRMEELGKRKLNSRYRNVTSKLHDGTLSSRSCPRPPARPMADGPATAPPRALAAVSR